MFIVRIRVALRVQPHGVYMCSNKHTVGCITIKSLTGEGDRVDVLAVIADGHLGLTKTDRVLSSRNAIELLELSLINKLDEWTRTRKRGGRELIYE